MKIVFKIAVGLAALAVMFVSAAYAWASVATHRALNETHTRHEVDIPMPWPLTEAEVAELRAATRTAGADAQDLAAHGATEGDAVEPLDLEAVAMERAIARGEHLITERYACTECHGADLAGGIMIDDPTVGGLYGPNLTGGEGGVTRSLTMTDWDHIVRHGVSRDGSATLMPITDYLYMSDQELSDIVAAVEARRDVHQTMPTSVLSNGGRIKVATGRWPLAVDEPGSLADSHAALPPSGPQVGTVTSAGTAGVPPTLQ